MMGIVWPQFSKEELALLAGIYECPKDAMRYLVYADWLEERGDPLAEFIRVQCELECVADGTDSQAALRKRERAAKRGRIDKWRGYRRGHRLDGGFRCGLPVMHWRGSDRDFLRWDGALERYMTPRHGVDLTISVYDEAALPRLFVSPLFRQLRRLHLIGPLEYTAAGVRYNSYNAASRRLLGGLRLSEKLEDFRLEYGSWRPYDTGGGDLGMAAPT